MSPHESRPLGPNLPADATPPVILEGPKNVTVPPGGELLLSCLVEGAPTPDVIISFRENAYLEKVI